MERAAGKIIVDLDNAMGMPVHDVDDGLALALALASPEVEIMACLASPGNCTALESAQTTCAMLKAAGFDHIPVGLGPEKPIGPAKRHSHFAFLENHAQGPGRKLWPADTPNTLPCKSKTNFPSAPTLLAELARMYPGEITVVALASLTNIALALELEPDLPELLAGIVHMGGTTLPDDPPWSTPDIPDSAWRDHLRFNTLYDPHASVLVLKAGFNFRLIGPGVTMQVQLEPEHLGPAAQWSGDFGSWLHESTLPWLVFSREHRKLRGAHMHDPLAMAQAMYHAASEHDLECYCRYENVTIDLQRLLTEENEWITPVHTGDNKGKCSISMARTVNADMFLNFFSNRLKRLKKR